MEKNEIIDDPSQYGSKGQSWASEFVAYMKAIVTHPTYNGMPDAVKDDGKIQWEAPSNRSGGQYQFTHNKRRDWWRAKAESLGIDTKKDQWISKTAKKIHPTGEKPCKRCGEIMRIAYVYPQANLIKRFKKYLGEDFEISTMEPIHEAVQRAYDLSPENLFSSFKKIFSTKDALIPDLGRNIDDIFSWLDNDYIPNEPSILSPGVMSNAPDRFDGFHSFNRCCRGKADTGRHAANLRSYTTDRRVFEFWSEGDWIAADRLMGLVKTLLRNEPNADGGEGPPTADHIGPLSLGFCHRPEFKLLSKAANSAKNNRMSLEDVLYLIECENKDISVASWYAKPLWDQRKLSVDSDEKALRLSKMLRDNQRNAMKILCSIFESEKYAFLVYLLELHYADRKVEFENLRSEKFVTIFDSLLEEPRTTKYSSEQKSRRIRIGFEALRTYIEKNNRHGFEVEAEAVSELVKEAINILSCSNTEVQRLDDEIKEIIFSQEGGRSEYALREWAQTFPSQEIESFEKAKKVLSSAMLVVGNAISSMWDSDRYVREEFEDVS
ncbi:Alw26I/Eco31I/Esp3I family type II restriction endonuclease [Marinospirillum minutulum]|uniref:Alw26I/Eco31I/Esp3I family type II restriction endonuclease n=1 Tax=Marinospirillum minutulum TaxID=64974 RepID=UPI00040BBA56|nr:Alw26I/Eco31I/Esp3I family type II restriction endonuclease [Marinospirillum minutulum]